MDVNNLFPTFATNGVGYNSNQFTEKLTNTISTTGVSDSYFLGYIKPTEIPSTSFSTKVTYNSDDDIITFESCEKNNVEVGYVKNNAGNWTSYGFSQSNDNDTYNYGLSNFQYFNNFYPEFASLAEALRINIRYILYNPVGAFDSFSTTYRTIGVYSNIIKFFNGDIDLVFQIPDSNSTQHNFSVNFKDFVSGEGTVFVVSVDGYQARIFITNVIYAGGSVYNGSYSTSPNYAYSIKTMGKFEDGTDSKLYIFGQRFGSDTTGVYCQFFTGNAPGYGDRRIVKQNTYDRGYGIYETIEMSPDSLPNSANTFTFRKGILAHCVVTNAYCNFYVYITNPESIKSVMGLAFRTNPGNVASYVNGSSYATDILGNIFAAKLKTGDITDTHFKASLESWQYVDFDTYDPVTNPQGVEVNTFTEEDIPPYVPPTGEEGTNPDNPDAGLLLVDDTPEDQIEEDRMNDARAVFAANAFITQYVLTLAQLMSLGQYLWSGITDPNSETLKNFVAIFSDTGTFNSANCMQCFVSLKVFPFDMFNTVYSSSAPDLRAGSGHTALLSESVKVFGSCTYSIDCGTVDVTADGYNIVSGQYDFRNYINTTVCVFLPYCGTVELNPSDVFGFTLSCNYYIDVSSGTCTACVFVDRGDNKRLMVASKSGQIGFNIPMSATNAMQVAGTFLSDAASAAQTISDTVLSIATARTMGSIGASGAAGANSAMSQQTNVMATNSAVGKTTSGIAGAISGLGNMMSRSGCAYPSLSGGTGMAALFFDKTPYVVIRRSNYSSPNNYPHTTGFATTDGGTEHKPTLGAYSGWTVVKNCDLKNIHANREELDEIKHLLETGVFL